jgi:putative transposase
MEEDTVVRLPRPGSSVADDPLPTVLRAGARRMLQQVIEAEVETFLAAHVELEDAHPRSAARGAQRARTRAGDPDRHRPDRRAAAPRARPWRR